MNKEVQTFPYIIRFSLAYAAALILIAIIMEVLKVDSSTGSSMGSLIAAVSYTAFTFVKDHKRMPSTDERKKLTWLSLVASFIISLVLVIAFLGVVGELGLLTQLPSLLSQVGPFLMLGVFLFVVGIYYAGLWVSYGWFAKIQYQSMEKKGEL